MLDGNKFRVRWFKKINGRGKTVKFNLTDQTDVLGNENVMLWNFGLERSDDSLVLSSTDIARIEFMYENHDVCYK